MNVYDFDKTVYARDSSISFYLFCLRRNPKMVLDFPGQFLYFIMHLLNKVDAKKFKEIFFSFLKHIDDIDKTLDLFWRKNKKHLEGWYLAAKKADDVIVSASPEFLIQPICREIGIKGVIGTEMDKKTGVISGDNCKGAHKARMLLEKYPGIQIDGFFSDSLSDEPLARLASVSYIVRRGKHYMWNL